VNGELDGAAPGNGPTESATHARTGRTAGKYALPIGVMLLSFALALNIAGTPRWLMLCFLVAGVAITLAGIRATVGRGHGTGDRPGG
jgi:hypothetical protein